MCQCCSYRIINGDRHWIEYIILPGLLEEKPEAGSKPTDTYYTWKSVRTDHNGLRVRMNFPLRLKKIGFPSWLKYRKLFKPKLQKMIEVEYNRPVIHLKKLLCLRNPYMQSRLYFRQILMGGGRLFIANAFGYPHNGVLELRGRPTTLAKLVREMYSSNSSQKGQFLSDESRMISILTQQHRVLKLMDGYFFAVGEGIGAPGLVSESFEFGSGAEALEKIVLRGLKDVI